MSNDIDVKLHPPDPLFVNDVSLHHAMTTLGERWKEAREEAGLGMNELDRKIGQKSGYTSRVEADGKPEITMYVVDRAARALGVRLEWLVRGEGPKSEGSERSATAKSSPATRDAKVVPISNGKQKGRPRKTP